MVFILVISTIIYKSLCPLALLHCCYEGLCWESPREQTLICLPLPYITQLAACVTLFTLMIRKANSFNYKCVQFMPPKTPQESDNTPKHQPGRVYQRLFWWPFLSETLLMWLNAGRGWNLRCGVLFLSETILIMLPCTPPTKHLSNKQGKCLQFVSHIHNFFFTFKEVCVVVFRLKCQLWFS